MSEGHGEERVKKLVGSRQVVMAVSHGRCQKSGKKGMRGRFPEPTKLKLLKGTRSSRINKNEPQPKSVSAAIPPGWAKFMSGTAKRYWGRYAPALSELGVLTEVDLPAFRILCELYSVFVRLTNILNKKGLTYEAKAKSGGVLIRSRPELTMLNEVETRYLQYAAQFGITPATRGRISLAPPDEDDEDLD